APTVPIAIPATPSPAATSAAHHGSDCDSGAEREQASGNQVGSAVPRRTIGHSINNGRVVSRYVYYLWICRLNDDRLLSALRLCLYRLLVRCLKVSGGLRLFAQLLDGCHHLCLLIVVRLSQLRGPREALRHFVQHGRKLRQRFYAWVPGLFINRLCQCGP